MRGQIFGVWLAACVACSGAEFTEGPTAAVDGSGVTGGQAGSGGASTGGQGGALGGFGGAAATGGTAITGGTTATGGTAVTGGTAGARPDGAAQDAADRVPFSDGARQCTSAGNYELCRQNAVKCSDGTCRSDEVTACACAACCNEGAACWSLYSNCKAADQDFVSCIGAGTAESECAKKAAAVAPYWAQFYACVSRCP